MADEPQGEQPAGGQPDPDSNCENEFKLYEKYREQLVKQEIENEKSYDDLLGKLSSAAIGATFLLRDFGPGPGLSPYVVLAWICFGVCLGSSLVDRLLSYWTHRKAREVFDTEFSNWREGAFYRAVETTGRLPFMWLLPRLKWVGFATLLSGTVFLMVLVGSGTAKTATPATPPPAPTTSPSPVNVNVYNSNVGYPTEPGRGLGSTAIGDTSMSDKPQPRPTITTTAPDLDIKSGGPIPPAAPKPSMTIPATTPAPQPPKK